MGKLRIGVFKFTSCSGCQLSMLRVNEQLLNLLNLIDIDYWVMVSDVKGKGPYDLALVEGSVSTPEEIGEIKEIRSRSRILVALGDCATYGGLNSIRNYMSQREVEKLVYENPTSIRSTTVRPLDYYVDVDIYLSGCPPDTSTIVEVIKDVALGVPPRLPKYPVCVECKLSENECLLIKGEPCMGPVIKAGCGALCPNLGRICEGCYGPAVDPNAESLLDKWREIGLSEREIVCKLRKYAGLSKEFKRWSGL
ncbi:MAG: oxidoreductase [Thermofilum sp. ex4484_15]|nr:MAG: oxidoreductase [Thermofilum sp. ex4484_15]